MDIVQKKMKGVALKIYENGLWVCISTHMDGLQEIIAVLHIEQRRD